MQRRQFLESALAFLAAPTEEYTLYFVPNSHDVVSGWLTDFQVERNTSLNNNLAHLDRLKEDPSYRYVLSEVPNLISLLDFAPERLEELIQCVREKRLELVNVCFLEATASISGGEALAQLGVQGIRWFEAVMKTRPRFAWMIDLVGAHAQLPQIALGWGVDALVYCRNNPATKSAYWWVAPDGSRMLTIVNAQTYVDFPKVFTASAPLTDQEFKEIAAVFERKRAQSPSKRIGLSLAGSNDYSTPPVRKDYPRAFAEEYARRFPGTHIRLSTFSDYLDALKKELRSGETQLEEHHGGTPYSWNAFWIDLPAIKRQYRDSERLMLAGEMAMTAASLWATADYPSRDFNDAWINLLMNTDRNVLWGSVGGAPLKDPNAWDAQDRYAAVARICRSALDGAFAALTRPDDAVTAFNPLNWPVRAPIEAHEIDGSLADYSCEADPERPNLFRCAPPLGPCGFTRLSRSSARPVRPREIALPDTIDTLFYTARLHPRTAALVSLQARGVGKEILGGPANVLLAEDSLPEMKKRPKGETYRADFMLPRGQRQVLDHGDRHRAIVKAYAGPLATTVVSTTELADGTPVRQRLIFYREHPRIDCEIEVELRHSDVLLTVDFPLASDVVQRVRGIPFGFEARDPRRPMTPRNEYLSGDQIWWGYSEAILPAVRWSSYRLGGPAGLAILDRGLVFREVNGPLVTLGLVNAASTYHRVENEFLKGIGRHVLSYSLVPHAGCWRQAGVPRLAYEFNVPPVLRSKVAPTPRQALIETSNNVIVEAVRRTGSQVEVRFYESQGIAGEAIVRARFPHTRVSRTNFLGEHATPLHGGPAYAFPVRPQEIVTLRFDVDSPVPAPDPLRSWIRLVPEAKRDYLRKRFTNRGHTGAFP